MRGKRPGPRSQASVLQDLRQMGDRAGSVVYKDILAAGWRAAWRSPRGVGEEATAAVEVPWTQWQRRWPEMSDYQAALKS